MNIDNNNLIYTLTHRSAAYKIKLKNFLSLPALGILLFTFYILTQRWFDLYSHLRVSGITVVRVLEVAVVCLALLLIMVGVFNNKSISKKLSIIDFLWFPGIMLILIYVIYVGGNKYDLFIYSTGFVFLVLAKTDIKDIGLSFSLIKYSAFIFALGSLTQFFFTDYFNDFILNFTTKYSLEDITSMVQSNYYPGLTFTQPAITAGYMVLGLGIILSFWSHKNKVQISHGIIIFLILFISLLIIGKRSILLWTIVTLLFTYITLSIGKTKMKRGIIALITVIVLSGIIYIMTQVFDSLPFFIRIDNLISYIVTGEATGSVRIRLMLYQDAWVIFLNNPLFGIGWKQFEILHHSDYSVHNVYLQLLSEMGIIGFMAIMVPFSYTYLKTYKSLKSILSQPQKINSQWKKGLSFSFFYQTFFLLYCITENPFYHLFYLLFYFVAISVVGSFIVYESDPLYIDQKSKNWQKI